MGHSKQVVADSRFGRRGQNWWFDVGALRDRRRIRAPSQQLPGYEALGADSDWSPCHLPIHLGTESFANQAAAR